ncbi:MAG: tRNA adenosine(34) deaminase TadA [Candidatus Eisenbacteria bacterium]
MDLGHDSIWMTEALKEARRAFEEGEVPVGAIVVAGGKIIGRGHNRVENLKDATAHAEIIALGAASSGVGDWRLEESTVYVTLEPCVMCLGAMFLARVARLVFGSADRRGGACGGAVDLGRLKYMDREITIDGGMLEEECKGLLLEFFSKVRKSEEP